MALTQDQLYSQQQKMNQYGSAIAGGASLIDDWSQMQHQNDMINTNVPNHESDAFGKPVYNLGNLQQNINQIDTSQDSFGGIAKANLTGSFKGAAAGSAFGPWGALIGGAIGGVGGIISGFTAGAASRRKKRLAQQNLFNAQRMYNTQMAQYNLQQSGQQAYYDNLNNSNREFNIYKFNSPYS